MASFLARIVPKMSSDSNCGASDCCEPPSGTLVETDDFTDDFDSFSVRKSVTFSDIDRRLFEDPLSFRREDEQKKRMAQALCVVSEGFENAVFYSIICNFVLFVNMNPFHWYSYAATSGALFFFFIVYLFAVVGGWLADTFVSRYSTLLLAFVPYACGYGLFIALSVGQKQLSDNVRDLNSSTGMLVKMCPASGHADTALQFLEGSGNNCVGLVYLAVVVVASGMGTFKANMPAFAGRQHRNLNMDPLAFFNWYYWSMNNGMLLAALVICYVQQNFSFLYGYIGGLGLLCVSFIVLLAGSPVFEKPEPCPEYASSLLQVLWYALSDHDARESRRRMRLGATAADRRRELPSRLDMAKLEYGGRFNSEVVNEARSFLHIIPVFLALVPYWTALYQMFSTFYLQALHLRLPASQSGGGGGGHRTFPIAWMTLCESVVVAVALPLIQLCLYRRYKALALHTRVTFGLVMTALSMLSAALLELVRRQHDDRCLRDLHRESCGVVQTIGLTQYRATDISIWWQAPQYVFLALGEIFTNIGCLEFAHSEAPQYMRGMVMGLYYLCCGVGALLALAAVAATTRGAFCTSANAHTCHTALPYLDLFFFVLFLVMLLDVFVYYAVATCYNSWKASGHSFHWLADLRNPIKPSSSK